MTSDPLHADAIAAEMTWLASVIDARLTGFFTDPDSDPDLPAPPAQPDSSALGALIASAPLDTQARIVLALAMAPHVNSALLDPFFVKNSGLNRGFSQFGGVVSDHAGFRPTAETALFLVAGARTDARIRAMTLFDADHPLRRKIGLTLGSANPTQPEAAFAAILHLPAHRVIALCSGTPPKPDFSPEFPAHRLTTGLDWDDLVLSRDVMQGLGHITAWMENRSRILEDWGLASRLGKGFKALFYGPPGTGKTLTATLLGKTTGLDVYRIDLSAVVSKYIGETEKNLATIFDLAAERDWILFFDEADALFGTRTQTTSSNDRHANQEVAYLLQRIEECESLVILASNLRGNIDEAFFRRFQMAIGFTRPDREERKLLWTHALSNVPLGQDVDIPALAESHELTGGSISNVVRHATITALRRGSEQVDAQDFSRAVVAELRKEGRVA